jgi:hypothetical protein
MSELIAGISKPLGSDILIHQLAPWRKKGTYTSNDKSDILIRIEIADRGVQRGRECIFE